MLNLLLMINTARKPEIPLKNDIVLTKIAQERCVEMKEFSHNKFGSYYSKLMLLKGYKLTGENLALNFKNATSTFQALENSPGHYKNNHNPLFRKVGIANCNNKLGNTTVILFGN